MAQRRVRNIAVPVMVASTSNVQTTPTRVCKAVSIKNAIPKNPELESKLMSMNAERRAFACLSFNSSIGSDIGHLTVWCFTRRQKLLQMLASQNPRARMQNISRGNGFG
ncbi:MAG: hypothetical protein AUK47_16210 [Deltaproteobacteria bacterium CG2_30_63_29]|nr:MAG: hypothetical protein AUK47_16210 [Deltaproteobacteria bacterium CG2_30_63_29]PJB48294.1 MAG: hypothetical protein CO108_02600 [Deltaproteobacteria bacterium CG_4_9_14_3_um_filter_63_12]